MRNAGSRPSGFTLIELLVSLSIVAVLMSLLLPAVQQAREVARRESCKNNLKQIGTALHNYHDVNGSFPIGARAQRATGNAAGYGPSWWVGLLPYLDQTALYDQFDMLMHNNGDSTSNPALATYYVLPFMLCPSREIPDAKSPVPSPFPGLPPQPAELFPNYVGIAGAVSVDSTLFIDQGFKEERSTICCSNGNAANRGKISAGGILVTNLHIRIADVTDGTSNVIAVGEQNGRMFDTYSNVERLVEGSGERGWAAGTSARGVPPAYMAPSGSSPSPGHNLTTIRYPLSLYEYSPVVHKGIEYRGGPNNPLLSEHKGGVHVLLTDGAVRLMSINIDLWELKKLSTRDDGQVVSW